MWAKSTRSAKWPVVRLEGEEKRETVKEGKLTLEKGMILTGNEAPSELAMVRCQN